MQQPYEGNKDSVIVECEVYECRNNALGKCVSALINIDDRGICQNTLVNLETLKELRKSDDFKIIRNNKVK